ncbi:M10 family metallopeptidase C-terminal domain-containing protein [Microvirga sp. GCM10011540]|uniref:M10 family metallopeptidase C-terminal domain-containing protein n=1 Tax=Microvirga sp. GCM10011540 TaxID=3317338 RepID=UPI0036176A41
MPQAPIPVEAETRVIETLSGSWSFPYVRGLAGGGWVVTWSGNGNGDDRGVFQQVYNADGSKKGGEVLVNTTVAGRQSGGHTSSLADGGWIVIWSGNGESAGNEDDAGAFLQVYNADGSRRGGEILVNTTKEGSQAAYSVSVLANGDWVVTWTGPDPESSNPEDRLIFQQLLNPDGSKKGNEIQVSTDSRHQSFHQLAALSDGGWVVTWSGYSPGADPQYDVDVFQQVFNADGSRRGAETLVNTTTAGQQFGSGLTALSNGKWVVTWYRLDLFGMDDPNAVDPKGVYQQVYNADGSKSGGEILVNTTTVGTQQVPSVTALANGEWVVTWIGPDSGLTGEAGFNDHGIYQQVFNADGSKKGGEIRVNTTTVGVQTSPSIATVSRGEWVVVWQGDGAGDDTGIFQQRFRLEGATAPVPPADLVLVGTKRTDKLVGGAGHDKLYGKSGKDVLTGGAGQDIFVFDTKPNKKKNLDTIRDFSVADDTIWLDNKIFKKLGKKGSEAKPVKLNKKFFSLEKAKGKDDYLVYSKKKGILYYDADGSGAGKAVEIAKMTKKLKLTANDFFVV